MITLLYVRPACDDVTELDRRVGTIVQRYARWVTLRVVRPDEVMTTVPMAQAGSPALLLMRAGDLVGEAVGALLPARELDQAVRRAARVS